MFLRLRCLFRERSTDYLSLFIIIPELFKGYPPHKLGSLLSSITDIVQIINGNELILSYRNYLRQNAPANSRLERIALNQINPAAKQGA
jgi:hypothetical protein